MRPLYKVSYTDGTVFKGGTINKSNWEQINKPIKSLEYYIGKKIIYLEGWENYNHLVKRVQILFGGKVNATEINLLMQYSSNVFIININLRTLQLTTLDTLLSALPNIINWKIGIQGTPTYKIF
jgi:hypothetical protein